MTEQIQNIAPSSTPGASRLLQWVKANFFSNATSTIISAVFILLSVLYLPDIFSWAIWNSTVTAQTPDECSAVSGACWSFVREKGRLILFGFYPADQHWRPLVASITAILILIFIAHPKNWNKRGAIVGTLGVVFWIALMGGGIFGLTHVPVTSWGGLPLTIALASTSLLLALPLGVLLALGRRSDLPAVKSFCIFYIELIRGVPLISMLFVASFMIPLFLPVGVTVSALLRAQIALTLFASALIAEAVRGGLQAVPKGQFEAADALGLGYWSAHLKIILPQAMKISLPAISNIFIGLFKDTSLVAIVSLMELLLAMKAAIGDPEWREFFVEGYIFTASIYFVFTLTMSKYSQYLERYFSFGHQSK